MLAMKLADEERNRLLYASIHTQYSKLTVCMMFGNEVSKQVTLVMYPCMHNSVNLTFWYWQWSEQMHEERKQVSYLKFMHPYIHNLVKLTAWCWQWSEQMRRETGYSGHASFIYMQFSKTHHLMLAMHEVSRWGEKTGYSGDACIHVCTIQ